MSDYLWVRPLMNAPAAPNWETNSGQCFKHWRAGVPTQYQAERPCPYLTGCGDDVIAQWLDPVYGEYRNPTYPRMGEWPPPQPGTDYDDWLAQQRQWMPYEAIAYSGVDPDTPCSSVLGVPLPAHTAHWTRFDFASHADWPFVTAWSGIRIVAQVNKHRYVTNEGECTSNGPARLVVGVYRHSVAYPTLPATWDAGAFSSQEIEFNNYGAGNYVNPYGYGVVDVVIDITVSPSGSWLTADQGKFWVIIGQKLSAQGNGGGSNNQILAVRKMWAAAITTLGGAPSSSSPDSIHCSVVG